MNATLGQKITAGFLFVFSTIALIGATTAFSQNILGDYLLAYVTIRAVKLTDNFWSPRLKLIQTVTFPHCIDWLGGIKVIKGRGLLRGKDKEIEFKAIPYYAWANRAPGKMKVWIPKP